ncbi:transcriptional regulator [Litchfieldella anticariensis FP35 = DSM 16096]|uniref:Transcriptional regulator n=1 Tax=Litchfieldella anticariensis (strain DSM 16096 / CECT 5854 / CIP 108499 / LMG 22089 / FP35) TaxID=1121939 RepID=S2KM32_LITA3|nr:LysR family transcriptional regulator [Halomonas anticariensis]EPC01518.1 transcriptional regulator [Halomonas anticariensis FP35 = DSM 16096]
MERLEDLEAFVAVVEQGGLTTAAHQLGRRVQSVSRSLASLEKNVGVELVERTTRRSVPSEAGLAFYLRVKPALEEIKEARLEAVDSRLEPSGLLRIGAPVLFAPVYLVPIVAEFMKRYPQVNVELKLSDRFVDFAEEELDLAVRIGHLPDSDLKARRLGELRRVTFGAPGYFARHGRPQHPADLKDHACILRTVDRNPGTWTFQVEGKRCSVQVSGPFRADTMTAIYSAVTHELGIGFSPLWQIRDLVEEGKVEVILTSYEPPPVPVHILWPPGRSPLAKTRIFKDYLLSRWQDMGLV